MIEYIYTRFSYPLISVSGILAIIFFILILIINRLTIDSFKEQNESKLKEYIKAQKGLLWSYFTILAILFLYFFMYSLNLYREKYRGVIDEHIKKRSNIRNIVFLSLFILNTGMTYYMNKILNEVSIKYNKNDLNNIYIILPILGFINYIVYSINIFNVDINYRRYRFYINDPVSITRKSSPSNDDEYSISRGSRNNYGQNDYDYDTYNDDY